MNLPDGTYARTYTKLVNQVRLIFRDEHPCGTVGNWFLTEDLDIALAEARKMRVAVQSIEYKQQTIVTTEKIVPYKEG